MNSLVFFIMLFVTTGLNSSPVFALTSWVSPLVVAYAPTESGADEIAGDAADTAGLSRDAVIEKMAEEIQSHNWAESFLFVVVDLGIITISLGLLLSFYRIIRGPQLPDRVLAGDTFSFHVVGLVILLAIRLRTEVFFDAALVVAIIGFASTLAFAQYIGNRRKRTVAP